jgi:rhamnogalacturonyl hydrolase YesR
MVMRIGDKLIRETPFEYRLGVSAPHHKLDRMHCVDFGRAFGLGRAATAYAWTTLSVPEEISFTLEIEHNDGCRVWLNGDEIYHHVGDGDINLRFEERSLVMSREFRLHLRKGVNILLLKSETRGREWTVFLQPPATHGAVIAEEQVIPVIGLYGVERIDAAVAGLSNWLLAGPFPNPLSESHRSGLETAYGPETEFRFGRMYPGLDGDVTWTIPKVEILGGLIDPLPWGTNYNWNYHNGGVAWAMQALTAVSGEPGYAEYAARFCDFHLDGIPFVEYQVKNLHAVDSANHFIIDTPLLDFTLAPSLPFIQRLRDEGDFARRGQYEEWIRRMIRYARNEQVRLPGHSIFTRTTPVEFTTWVDDMFMGIPFLVQAALYCGNPAESRELLDDAARQALEFNTQVWDEEARLYMHARFSGDPVKLPHWSRCNGWASWAMSEVLMVLPENHPARAPLLEQFRRHCNSLRLLQHGSGLWHNVLDHPESALEVSGTAIFVMAMARGILHGWLDPAVYQQVVLSGWKGLESRIDDDGTVHDICMGTMCTADVGYYINRPFYDDDTHGLFAVLFAGIEVQRMLADGAGRCAADRLAAVV